MKVLRALVAGASAALAINTFSAKVLVDTITSQCELIESVHSTQLHRAIESPTDSLEIVTGRQNPPTPHEILPPGNVKSQIHVEILGGSTVAVLTHLHRRCPHGVLKSNKLEGRSLLAAATAPVVRRIVNSGDPSNRIDIVFMGDGYTASEDSRFFGDIQRLTDEMFKGDTFSQYLPLFNVWAVYVPSNQSGIGYGGKPLDTAFGMYRDGNEVRTIAATNTTYAREVCKATGLNACDFPSLIGNDDYYGGLGGAFVIATRSPTSGTIVLRHEMGHNFGKVGEEYDGGKVYYGANSVTSVAGVTWKHWLTDPNATLREEKAVIAVQEYMWSELKNGSYVVKFNSTGAYKRWSIALSVTGADTPDAVSISLDGQPLEWKTRGTKDRTFSVWSSDSAGFSAGRHVLEVRGNGPFQGFVPPKQLCSVKVYEYAGEDEFKQTNRDHIGIYPTWDYLGRKTFRPDNDKCLMRNMSSVQFCSVCQETMWLQFMARIKFIDAVVVSGKNITVKVIPLGQLRPPTDPFVVSNPAAAAAEKYTITWLNNGKEVVQFRDLLTVNTSAVAASSTTWTVRVQLLTPNVRLDPKKYLKAERSVTVV